jgi:sortase (surface protein transpeptidase)
MSERLSRILWGLIVAVGLAAVGLGLSVFLDAWQTSRAWVGSAEALHADLPAESPTWIDPPAEGTTHRARAGSGAVRAQFIAPPPAPPDSPATTPADTPSPAISEAPGSVARLVPTPISPLTPTSAALPATPSTLAVESATSPPNPAVSVPASLPAPDQIALVEADFRFLDPPEPGAHARLAVTLQSRADRPTGPLALELSSRWLQSFQVFGAIPSVLDDRAGGEGERQFVFGGLGPGERQTVELHVVASAEEIDAPEVRVLLSNGAEVARAHPRTVAPRPRPGPARAIAIPKLGVNAAVVPVLWEPPPFVIGQLQGTSAVSEGNSVLVGHLRGPAGDVFARLDRLRPGDEVVATSRGLEYRFVVSEVAVRPYDDVQPTQPTTTPRLTMMTCTGTWSIARQDYSHRLWVVAEPPEIAQQTIAANAEKAAQAAREAEAAAARATHEAETQPTPVSEAEVGPAEPTPAPPAPTARPVQMAPTTLPEPTPEPSGPTAPTLADVASPGANAMVPGIAIDAPAEGATVPQRLVVRGRRTPDAPPGLSLWLVVRADLEGSRWYALGRPLAVKADGSWEALIELGGAACIHHEIRVGAVDATAEAALRRHASEHPGQPLDDLPAGFQTGVRVTVERR